MIVSCKLLLASCVMPLSLNRWSVLKYAFPEIHTVMLLFLLLIMCLCLSFLPFTSPFSFPGFVFIKQFLVLLFFFLVFPGSSGTNSLHLYVVYWEWLLVSIMFFLWFSFPDSPSQHVSHTSHSDSFHVRHNATVFQLHSSHPTIRATASTSSASIYIQTLSCNVIF